MDPLVSDLRVKHALIKGKGLSSRYFLRWHSHATKMSKQEVVDRKPFVCTDVIPLFNETKLQDGFLGDGNISDFARVSQAGEGNCPTGALPDEHLCDVTSVVTTVRDGVTVRVGRHRLSQGFTQ